MAEETSSDAPSAARQQAQVKRIMSGPNAYICNECVELCSTILHEDDV